MVARTVRNNNYDCIFKVIIKVISFFVSVLLLYFVLYGIKLGINGDKIELVNYIKKFGWLAPLFFILLQMFQVVFPVIPGGASCLAGVLAFGPIYGFIYNYVGLVLGSVIVYFLSRKYGIGLINKFFGETNVLKYITYIWNNQFERIFFLGIFLPGLPDDLLCYVAGISKIKFRKFLFIILVGKPWTLLLYSFFINYI